MISTIAQAIGKQYQRYISALEEAQGLIKKEALTSAERQELSGLVERLQSDRSAKLLMPEQRKVLEEVMKKAKRSRFHFFNREPRLEALENIEGNLKNAYKLIVPGTMQHADELMNARRTDRTLRDFFFYTADGNFYFMENGKPYWAITREPENLILCHIDEAFPQLTQQQNYCPDPEEMADVLAAEDTVLIDLSQCLLSGNDDEWRYIGIGTGPERYNQLTAEGRKAAERIFGQGDDFAANMQMLSSANIQETRIYVLNPTYIAQHAPQGVLGRASWLRTFLNYSYCFAYARGLYDHCRLRGVRR